MKSRLLIIVGLLAVLGFWISFVAWETYHSQPIESIDESTYLSSDESLQRVLDHCESQRKFAAGEIPERNADGSFNAMDLPGLSFQNSTHYIDNYTCELENVKNDFTGRYFDYNYPKCFSDKIDPVYGVIVANETHMFNPKTCLWELGLEEIKKTTYPSLFNNTPEMVESILRSCNSTGISFDVGKTSSNGTHIITNNTCKWQTVEKYESDRALNYVLSICDHDVRDPNNESWSNSTHYINGNDCEWKENEK